MSKKHKGGLTMRRKQEQGIMAKTLLEIVLEGLDELEKQGASGKDKVLVQIGIRMTVANGEKAGARWEQIFQGKR
jgi:hypothetical protein